MEKKEVVIGHVKHARIALSDPDKMTFDMDYNSMMILVGQNGTGKTLVLKLTWMMASMANYFLHARTQGGTDPVKTMQYLVNGTLGEHTMTGELEFVYDCGEGQLGTVLAKFDAGQVTACECSFDEHIVPSGQPIFMSTTTRLLNEHVRYLKTKDMLGLARGLPTIDRNMARLLEHYRLYDIIFMEQFFYKIEHQTTPDLIKRFNEHMQRFDEKFECEGVRIDYSKKDLLYTVKGVEKSLTTLGNGHQSLVSMLLFQSY